MSKVRAVGLIVLLLALSVVLSGCAPVMEDGVPMPPMWIRPLALPIAAAISFFNDRVLAPLGIASIGLSIILVTILLKLLLYPLTKKQLDSMRKMQELQPQMKEIQEKYGKDREKLAQKQMELYREAGVNPAMGCLPILLQMPILFAFYFALLALGPKLQEPFLWIPNLAFPEYFAGMSWLTPLTLSHLLSPQVLPYLWLPILYVVSQIALQRMSQAANPTALPGSTNTMMMLMPLMFGYITLLVPSGLTLYWVTSNILQIIQQGLTTGWAGLIPGAKPAQPAPAATKGSAPKATPAPSSASATAANPKGSAAEPAAAKAAPAPEMSAGRRRKLRKKKR
ncbi:MAG: YidC/Oxa1 family membrane protein insertase [Caldilineales bacterium]|nr:YidC/Oxa1 family membrane protein insertase [Caldilineales bacterium]MDW8317967.1 YidC/Oxa1 family membrane protein insertase [Anaerolineae bacterium]